MGMFVVAPASSFNHYQHHHHHEAINLASSDPMNASNGTALGVGLGVIPLLTTAPCLPAQNMDCHDLLNNGGNKISGIQFWQQNHATTQYNNTIKKGMLDHHSHHSNTLPVNLLQSGCNDNNDGGGGGNSSSSGTTTCQDCGNQAKKDCSHRRCRTCCKTRGFECSTHVKSTWVPAVRRRERQLMAATSTGGGGAGSSGATSGVKKPRVITSQQTATTSHTSTSNTTPPGSFDTSSSHQDASFKESLPPQVRAPAVFKCVRVTTVDHGEDEYAYQAMVKINGHVFKGFLYDQGVEGRDGFPNISDLHLGGGSGEGRNGATSHSPILDPSDVYGASGGGMLGDSSYGNVMN